MAKPEKIVRARSWSELPEVLEPGRSYDVDGVVIKPRVRLSREEAKALAQGIKEMASREP